MQLRKIRKDKKLKKSYGNKEDEKISKQQRLNKINQANIENIGLLEKNKELNLNKLPNCSTENKQIVTQKRGYKKRKYTRNYSKQVLIMINNNQNNRTLKHFKIKMVSILHDFLTNLHQKNDLLNSIKIAKLKKDSKIKLIYLINQVIKKIKRLRKNS